MTHPESDTCCPTQRTDAVETTHGAHGSADTLLNFTQESKNTVILVMISLVLFHDTLSTLLPLCRWQMHKAIAPGIKF